MRNPVAFLIQSWLDEKGWRAADIERRGGPTRQVISRWMEPARAWTQIPDPEHISGTAAVFGKPVALLQEALAQALGWSIVDREVSAEARLVLAAMSELDERDRQSVAQMALQFAESLQRKADVGERASVTELRPQAEPAPKRRVAKGSTAKSRRPRGERVAPEHP